MLLALFVLFYFHRLSNKDSMTQIARCLNAEWSTDGGRNKNSKSQINEWMFFLCLLSLIDCSNTAGSTTTNQANKQRQFIHSERIKGEWSGFTRKPSCLAIEVSRRYDGTMIDMIEIWWNYCTALVLCV